MAEEITYEEAHRGLVALLDCVSRLQSLGWPYEAARQFIEEAGKDKMRLQATISAILEVSEDHGVQQRMTARRG